MRARGPHRRAASAGRSGRTVADPAGRPADLVRRDFTATRQRSTDRWCGDITYIRPGGLAVPGHRHRPGLAPGRRIRHGRAPPRRAGLRGAGHGDAVRGGTVRGLILHSDRGIARRIQRSSQHLELEVLRYGRMRKRQQAIRAMRGQMSSPGRPSVAAARGPGAVLGRRSLAACRARTRRLRPACRRRSARGGSVRLAGCHRSCLAPLSGRYLSFAEREEIAILRAQELRGARDRPPRWAGRRRRSRESCAATRRPAVARLDYRATTAQWHAERRARRPKVGQARRERAAARVRAGPALAGAIARPDGEAVPGPTSAGSGAGTGVARTGAGPGRGARSRSRTGCGSTSPMMSPCGSPTRRSTRRCTSRAAARCAAS